MCCSIDKKSPSTVFTSQPNVTAFNVDGQIATAEPQSQLINPVCVVSRMSSSILRLTIAYIVVTALTDDVRLSACLSPKSTLNLHSAEGAAIGDDTTGLAVLYENQ